METTTIKHNILLKERKLIFYGMCLLLLISCTDFVEVEAPTTELVSSTVFTDAQTAEAALTGIYGQMTEGFGGFANHRTTLLVGLYADELDNYNSTPTRMEFYENALDPNNSEVLNLWREPYKYVYQANAVLEGLNNSEGIAGDIQDQLRGEALFIRAFCHFYLVSFFGDVPYITTTDYLENAKVSRLPKVQVNDHIVEDLEEATSLLSESYISGGRVRPNNHAAQALLARVYLYEGHWEEAEKVATTIINASTFYQLEQDLNQVFLSDSKEAIWQLYPVIPGLNTVEGLSFILSNAPSNNALSSTVVEAFDSEDLRRQSWVGSITSGVETYYYPYKYKVFFSDALTEYYMVLRLGEQYLIRAEARAQLNDLGGALEDLNVIRNRAGLDDVITYSHEGVLEAVFEERQRELFAEWGHRWFDLKRTGRADMILPLLKPGWQNTDVLFPIPQSELQNNPNIAQNVGY